MDVADVQFAVMPASLHHRFRYRVRSRNHDIGVRHLVRFGEEGEEGQIVPVLLGRKRKPLQETRVDEPVRDGGADGIGVVDQSPKWSFRKSPAKQLQDFFPSPHARQPIMGQRNLMISRCGAIPLHDQRSVLDLEW